MLLLPWALVLVAVVPHPHPRVRRLGLVARIKRLKQKLKDGDSLPSAMFTLQGYVGQEDAR